jgi:hypothetical protein
LATIGLSKANLEANQFYLYICTHLIKPQFMYKVIQKTDSIAQIENTTSNETYTLRVIYDDDKDKLWTSGSFIEQRQSEEVIYFPKEIDVRNNWDVEQPFDLSKK